MTDAWAAAALLLPLALWLGLGLTLALRFRRTASPALLRIAAAFAALWALMATTLLIGLLTLGGWSSWVRVASQPWSLAGPTHAELWVLGGLGTLALLSAAFLVNQLVGRGTLRLLELRPFAWPSRLPRPSELTTVYAFRSDRVDAFSFTLLEPPGFGRGFHRHELILLSEHLLEQLTPEETEAVVAHELGHVRDLDTRYLTFVRTFARLMRWDPVLAYLASRLTSREEFSADEEAARLTGHPRALARALFKALESAPTAAGVPRFAPGLLGGRGARGRQEAYRRIERLLALADSPEFREGGRE